MESKVEQFNNFSAGITDNLRANYEAPGYSRIWNFANSVDRMIQHGGWKKLSSKTGELLNHAAFSTPSEPMLPVFGANNGLISKPAQNVNAYLLLEQGGNGIQEGIACSIGDNENSYNTVATDGGTEPIIYNNAVVYRSASGKVYQKRFYGQSTSTLGDIILPNIKTFNNTFFVEGANNRCYIFTGRDVHAFDSVTIDPNGSYAPIAQSEINQYIPLNQYMIEGDSNGSPGTYTVGGTPVGYIITEIDKLQNVLKILGYLDGPADGQFGPLTDTALRTYQSEHNAVGEITQAGGEPLVVDGKVGPETLSAINHTVGSDKKVIEYENVMQLPYPITAVQAVGGTILFATKEDDSKARIYVWDTTVDSNGKGDVGLLTSVNLGVGTVQAIEVLNGKIKAIMSPLSADTCSSCYSDFIVYDIHNAFDKYPESYVTTALSLRIINSSDDNSNLGGSSYINRKTEVRNGKMYFSGKLHLESNRETLNGTDEGALSGIFSLTDKGAFMLEVSNPDTITDTEDFIESFAMTNGGFIISQTDGTYITQKDRDQDSGVITKIINGGEPWRNKSFENLYLALDRTDDLDEVRIYIREYMDRHESDAGWIKVYDSKTSDERRDFKNRIIINRNTETMKSISQFRELQIMVQVEGKCVELVDLTIAYNMLNLNK